MRMGRRLKCSMAMLLTPMIMAASTNFVLAAETTNVVTEDAGLNALIPDKYIATADGVRVRSGPGTQYGVLGTLSKRQMVSVISISNGWAKIKFGSDLGYVSAQYLEKS